MTSTLLRRHHSPALTSSDSPGSSDFSGSPGPLAVSAEPSRVSSPASAADRSGPSGAHARARDWAEIQERMLVPLYETVYDRLAVGAGTRLLGLGCGSGLALLLAARRGADVSGTDPDERRLDLARERLAPPGARGRAARGAPRLRCAAPGEPPAADGGRGYTVVTAFDPAAPGADGAGPRAKALAAAVPLAEPGSPVVLA
ncbi:methyltransferase domain-containing protein, partial [Streptomyces sp. B1866]|uniref:methyltransferase domain-containing protein n=1 Tax=Streptomyces sp. B1866 TaxID=3075431 RepID=UPI00288CE770